MLLFTTLSAPDFKQGWGGKGRDGEGRMGKETDSEEEGGTDVVGERWRVTEMGTET